MSNFETIARELSNFLHIGTIKTVCTELLINNLAPLFPTRTANIVLTKEKNRDEKSKMTVCKDFVPPPPPPSPKELRLQIKKKIKI